MAAAIHVASIAFVQLLILHVVRFSTSIQTLNGIAEVVFLASNYSLSDDFTTNLDTSLESLLLGVVDDVVVTHNQDNQRSEDENISISFRGYFDDFETIPACLGNNTFYYESETTNVTYLIASVSMQNFPNNFEDECTVEEKQVGFVEYIEQECRFEELECERSYNLNRLYRYELIDRGSVLYSFFCIEVDAAEDCSAPSDWLQMEWKEPAEPVCTIEEAVFPASRPGLVFIDDSGLEGLVHVDTFPMFLVCILLTDFGPPTLPIAGDQTWDKLPEWLKLCIRVLNGVSLAALLFCILTFAMFKELRNTHGKNVLSLVVAGMLSLFYTSGYIPLVTDSRELCAFIATLIYYFALVPNYWWTAVAIFLAWTLGRKGIHRMDEYSGTRFFLLLSLFGWGLPLIFALLVAFLHVGGVKVFDIDEYCWIIHGWPYYLITTQTLIPFIVDCVLFFLVVYRLRVTRLDLASMDSGGKSRRRNERQLTIKMAAIFGVFWLPSWIIYVAFLFNPITSLAIIAQLLNQLSTFILPIVLCCNRRVAALWKVKLAPLAHRFSSLTLSESQSSQREPASGKSLKNESPVDSNNIKLHEIGDHNRKPEMKSTADL